MCRWLVDDLIVDIMPTVGTALGFTNRWDEDAVGAATWHELEKGLSIRVVTAPHFVATKIEAFVGRGKGDFIESKDMEDIVALVDGREELGVEIASSNEVLRDYLRQKLTGWLSSSRFLEAIPGHLPGDAVSQARGEIVLERLRRIAR